MLERSKRPLRAVGLISTLSVALGVGSALASMPIAGADTAGSAGASDASSQPSPARDARGSARAGSQATPQAPAQRSSTSKSSAAPARRTRVDSASKPAITTGDNRASVSLGDDAVSLNSAVDSVAVAVEITDAAPAAATAPSLTAASPRGSLSAPGSVLLSLFNGGGNPGGPDAAPLAWAAVAVTRRESAANAVAAAASTTVAAASADPAVISLVDQYKTVLEGQVRSFISSSSVADVVAPLVANGAADWILNGTVGPELTQLASDATVGAFIAEQTALQLNNFGVPQQISSAVGSAVARAVQVAFGDATNTALIGAVDTFLGAVPWTSAPLLDTLTSLVSGDVTVVDIAGSQLGSTTFWNAATALLENAAVPQALGTATTTIIRDLAGSAAIRTLISDQLGVLIGATAAGGSTAAAIGIAINDALTGLLADADFLDALATTAGTTVSTFLSQPGIPGSVTGSASQIIGALMSGTDASAVLQAAIAGLRNSAQIQAAITATLGVAAAELLGDPAAILAALQLNPQLTAAIDATLPGFVNAVLGIDQLRQAVSAATGALITAALSDPSLADSGLGSLSGVAGTVTDAVVDSLLANPAVGTLISEVATDVLSGTPSDEALSVVVDSVLTSPMLQIAVGTALGEGFGALFGDNIIGNIVGWVAGGLASLTVGIAAGIANLILFFNPGFSFFPAAAAAASRTDSSYVLIVGATA